MRYFSTPSSSVQVVRKVGYYPSVRTARTLVVQILYVLELDAQYGPDLEVYLRTGVFSNTLNERLTPAETAVIQDMLAWWSVDSGDRFFEKAFVMVNLNEGRCVTLVAKRTESVKSIHHVEGRNDIVVNWRTASIEDVESLADTVMKLVVSNP